MLGGRAIEAELANGGAGVQLLVLANKCQYSLAELSTNQTGVSDHACDIAVRHARKPYTSPSCLKSEADSVLC